MLFATDAFVAPAKLEARLRGLPEMRMVVIRHPLGGNTMEEVQSKVEVAFSAVLALVEPGDERQR